MIRICIGGASMGVPSGVAATIARYRSERQAVLGLAARVVVEQS